MTRTRSSVFCFLLCLKCFLYIGSVASILLKEKFTDEIIDVKCDSNVNCIINNTICVDNTCQCSPGYTYNGEFTSCLTVVRYGENCEESIQCSKYLSSGGSCVNNVCVCAKGYYHIHGKCHAYTGLFKKCKEDDDCYVYADYKAAVCDKGICKCRSGFYQREYRSCRPEGKEIGSPCAIDNDCTFNSTAYCKNFECAVPNAINNELDNNSDDDDYNDALAESYTVEIEADIGSTCKTDEDCKDLGNALCGPLGTCVCERSHFFMQEEGKCVPELGEKCQKTDNVTITGSVCLNGIWTCEIRRVISLDNQACEKATRFYNNSCRMDIQCSIFGSDAICVNQSCLCNKNSRFIESEMFCWEKRGLNEKCQQDIDCYVDGINSTLSCTNNICTCPDGTHANSRLTACIQNAADLGMICEVNEDCATENAVCANEVCVCKDTYYTSKGKCVPGINANCTSNENCLAGNSTCTSGHCTCKKNYVAASAGLCMPVVSFGKPCEKDVQCSTVVAKSICSVADNSTTNKTCMCNEGYYNRFDECYKRKVLGASCKNLGECYLDAFKSRAVCKNGQCACDWGYIRINDTVCGINSNVQSSISGSTTRSVSRILPIVLFLTNILHLIGTY